MLRSSMRTGHFGASAHTALSALALWMRAEARIARIKNCDRPV